MHVDTGHNFPEALEFRDRRIAELGERLIVASVQESIDRGRAVEQEVATVALGQAVLVEAHDEWQVSDRRYLSEASMALLQRPAEEVAQPALVAS